MYFQGPRFYIAVQLFVTPPGGKEQIFETGGAAGSGGAGSESARN